MALPDTLERLKHISIDTLSLSKSTQALLKWHGITHVLDCIMFFYEITHYTHFELLGPWPRRFLLLFGEVKPALIAAGYWDLMLDAEMRQTLDTHQIDIYLQSPHRRVVRWQGRDQDLNNIPFEQLGLSEAPAKVRFHFKTIEGCISYFLYHLADDSRNWLEIGSEKDIDQPANTPLDSDRYMFRVAQPRLVELGLWRFVEEHIDDHIEEGRFQEGFRDDEDEEI